MCQPPPLPTLSTAFRPREIGPRSWGRGGGRVRLRIIKSAASTYFDMRIPGLTMTVVSADAQDVEPVAVDEIGVAVAETIDVVVTPRTIARIPSLHSQLTVPSSRLRRSPPVWECRP